MGVLGLWGGPKSLPVLKWMDGSLVILRVCDLFGKVKTSRDPFHSKVMRSGDLQLLGIKFGH